MVCRLRRTRDSPKRLRKYPLDKLKLVATQKASIKRLLRGIFIVVMYHTQIGAGGNCARRTGVRF